MNFIKALKQSKWYWFIPLISMIFLYQMSKWVIDGENFEERGWRSIVVDLTIPLHVISIFLILIYFRILN